MNVFSFFFRQKPNKAVIYYDQEIVIELGIFYSMEILFFTRIEFERQNTVDCGGIAPEAK